MSASGQSPLHKFLRKRYRDGYLQTKIRGFIAYQVQALREKMELNQSDFAKKIGKTQSVVSRLEDTDYGRVSVQTLLDIACALDVALVVKFVSYPEFLMQTRDASAAALQPQTIQESIDSAHADVSRSGAAYNHFLLSNLSQEVKSAQSITINDNDNHSHEGENPLSVYQQRSAPMLATRFAGLH